MRTKIQWCDSTVNPNSGCDGCELWGLIPKLKKKGGPCYAGNYQEVRMSKAMPSLYSADFTEVRLAPGRTAKAAAWSDLTGTARPDKPWLDGSPRAIFVGDMGDVMSKAVPFDYLKAELIDVALSPKGSRHVWMVLTKRPARLTDFASWLTTKGVDWPANVWAGTSLTTDKTLTRAELLCYHPAPVKFLSVEPMRGWIEFPVNQVRNFALVIVGGESRQGNHEPHGFNLAWGRDLVSLCRKAGTRPFVKQLGSRPYDRFYRSGVADQAIHLKDPHGGNWSEWPEDLRVREFPGVSARA